MSPIPFARRLIGAALCAALLSSPVRADELHDALEASLASGDGQKFVAVAKAHSDPRSLSAIFAWLKARADSGLVPDSFVALLVPFSLRAKDIPGALLYLSYYRALLEIDGSVCPDKSSAGSLLEGSIFRNATLARDPGITAEQKTEAVERAMALEESTSRAQGRSGIVRRGDQPLREGSEFEAPAGTRTEAAPVRFVCR